MKAGLRCGRARAGGEVDAGGGAVGGGGEAEGGGFELVGGVVVVVAGSGVGGPQHGAVVV